MKIEIGESLLYSWLRHVKECQVVQTNWKLSPKWKMENENKLRDIMHITSTYFNERYGYDIFKQNSLEQLLMQAEIDVLGIDTQAMQVYAIDVAFHEAGLNYGAKDETIIRVIKKCIRTAMCMYGYLHTYAGDIMFVTPKLNPAIEIALKPKIQEVNQIFQKMHIAFQVRLLANEAFNHQILTPVLVASEGIADTSELFLRSFQMCRMFANEYNIHPFQGKETLASVSTLSDEALKELKIGQLVQTTMQQLFSEEKITREEISNMLTKEYSKRVFHANLPILVEIKDMADLDMLRRDSKNYARYYAYTLSIYGKTYILSSQWIEQLHRVAYETWLKNQLSKR